MRRRAFLLGAAFAAGLLPGALRAEPQASPAAAGAPASPAPRPDPKDPENILYLDLSTGGRVTILLRPDAAPAHVERVKTLVRRGFYDGLIFHRVIDGFMAQTGDPKGTGEGGSDLPDLKAEFNNLPHMRGAVSMARTEEPDSANSQFFITFAPVLRLDRQYTVFGRVIAGMEWVDAIPRGEPPADPARILQASIAADGKPPPAFPKPAAALPADLRPSALPPPPAPPRP
ncbi:peptidylprolyl isomerase [Thermaurantiacus tibetensis]|uniref:peptidylprolyl isomerase n=1 Tax=Thermaurantiacus tibetensis TaxID=2759035 RepID=UPI00188E1542|nr:peptidylprolyl isomerase [Thermaurantiacus tibetensis]